MAKSPLRQVTSRTKENAMHALQGLRFVAERYTRLQALPISPLGMPFLCTDLAADRQSIAPMDPLTGPSLASCFNASLLASF
jgi:hypothetical protein